MSINTQLQEDNHSILSSINTKEFEELGTLFKGKSRDEYIANFQLFKDSLDKLQSFIGNATFTEPQNREGLRQLIENFVLYSTACYSSMEQLILGSSSIGEKALNTLQKAVKFYSACDALTQQFLHILLVSMSQKGDANALFSNHPQKAPDLFSLQTHEIQG